MTKLGDREIEDLESCANEGLSSLLSTSLRSDMPHHTHPIRNPILSGEGGIGYEIDEILEDLIDEL